MDLYQEYLLLIGKLKDIYKLNVDVDHKNIHTFYIEKRPLFKLLFGEFQDKKEESIVVSFHVDLYHPEVINWYINIYQISPIIKLHDSYMCDDKGETFLGEEAYALREIKTTQDILEKWLENYSKDEIKQFVETPLVVVPMEEKKVAATEEQALQQFEKLKKPDSSDEMH